MSVTRNVVYYTQESKWKTEISRGPAPSSLGRARGDRVLARRWEVV